MTHAAWIAYLRAYASQVQPAVLSTDHYDHLVSGDRGQFVENVAGTAQVAREYGLPFWGILLVIDHHGYRVVDDGLLRWQVAQWLSYGARGIGYFTYWTPAPDPNGKVPSLATEGGRPDRLVQMCFIEGDPAGCWDAPSLWPQRVIVMTLERVGSGAGPDLHTMAALHREAPAATLIGAGGVRSPADLARAHEAGASAWLVASALHDLQLPRAPR